MQVTLISFTPSPEQVVGASARLCYSKKNPTDVIESLSKEQCEDLISRVYNMGHTSTFEHATFVFSVQGVSRVLSHQLARHRIASYSQRSQRYVDESECDVVIPPSIANRPEAMKIFSDVISVINAGYGQLKALGIPGEDARYLLANATETNLIFTMNARALLNFFKERCCNRAQWEIRAMADQMLALVYAVAPNLFKKAGPTCVSEGICRQGKMCCGRKGNYIVK